MCDTNQLNSQSFTQYVWVLLERHASHSFFVQAEHVTDDGVVENASGGRALEEPVHFMRLKHLRLWVLAHSGHVAQCLKQHRYL